MMNQLRKRFSTPIAAASIIAAGLLGAAALHRGADADASNVYVAPAPINVGLVDLALLMNNLQELKDRNDQTMGKGKSLEGRLEEVKTQMKTIETELKEVIPETDTKLRLEKVAQQFELQATYEARLKAYQRIIDLDHGDILNDVYPKVVDAIKRFASKEGLDVIMVDDRPIPLPRNGTVKDYNEIIQRKRILFARDGLDLTEQLTTMMNNEYAASLKK